MNAKLTTQSRPTMTRCIRNFVLAVSLAGSAGAVMAEASAQDMLAGAGTMKCSSWTEARARANKAPSRDTNMMITWVQGMLSGMNLDRRIRKSGDTVIVPEPAEIVVSLDYGCTAYPNNELWQPALGILIMLEK